MSTIEEVRATGSRELFPVEVLEGSESALVLFAAGFLGRQDAVWIEEAGLAGTCIDTDAARLGEMQRLYPDDWTFIAADVFDWVPKQAGPWDVVTVDCSTNLFDRCAALAPDLCRVARRAVVLGAGPDTSLTVPVGWVLSERRYRSSFEGGVYWNVLERA